MQLDKEALTRMLALDDAGLRQLIATLAADAGMAPGQVRISDGELVALRRLLRTASPEMLSRMMTQLQARGGMRDGK